MAARKDKNPVAGPALDTAERVRAAKRASDSGVPTIRCRAELLQPAATERSTRDEWMFLRLPHEASGLLPSRGMVSIRGTFHRVEFSATLNPDGEAGHWLRVEKGLCAAAGVSSGDMIELEFLPVPPGEEPEPAVPSDLRAALDAASGKVRDAWSDITPAARRDFIHWITSAKRAETRARRIDVACDMLAKGKRRPCCFDRSGVFDKGQRCPDSEKPRKAGSSAV